MNWVKRIPLKPARYARSLWHIGRNVVMVRWDWSGQQVTQKDSGHVFDQWLFIGTVSEGDRRVFAMSLLWFAVTWGRVRKPVEVEGRTA